MKRARVIIVHIAIVAVLLGVLVGIPFGVYYPALFPAGGEVIGSASVVVPDKPSGVFYVFIKTDMHRDALADWVDFFHDTGDGVIFEDITCLVAAGDVNGRQTADRYAAILPANQMLVKEDNVTMVVSKIEAGLIDVAILSEEVAEAFAVKTQIAGVTVVRVGGNV